MALTSGDSKDCSLIKENAEQKMSLWDLEDDESFLLEDIGYKTWIVREEDNDPPNAYGKTTKIKSKAIEEDGISIQDEVDKLVKTSVEDLSIHSEGTCTLHSSEVVPIDDPTQYGSSSPNTVESASNCSIQIRNANENNSFFTPKIQVVDKAEMSIEFQFPSQSDKNKEPYIKDVEECKTDTREVSQQFDSIAERYDLATKVVDELRTQNEELLQVNQRNRVLLRNTLIHQQNIHSKMVSHLSEVKSETLDYKERLYCKVDKKSNIENKKREVEPEVKNDTITLNIPKDQVIELKINKGGDESIGQFTAGIKEIVHLVHNQQLDIVQQERERYIEKGSGTVLMHPNPVKDVIESKNVQEAHNFEGNDTCSEAHEKKLREPCHKMEAEMMENIECMGNDIDCIEPCNTIQGHFVPNNSEKTIKTKKVKKKGLWPSCFPTFGKQTRSLDKQRTEAYNVATVASTATTRVNNDSRITNPGPIARCHNLVEVNRPLSKHNCTVTESKMLRAFEIIYDDREMAQMRVLSLQSHNDTEKQFSQFLCQVQQVVFERNQYKNDLYYRIQCIQELTATADVYKRKVLRLNKQSHCYKSKVWNLQKLVDEMKTEMSHKAKIPLEYRRRNQGFVGETSSRQVHCRQDREETVSSEEQEGIKCKGGHFQPTTNRSKDLGRHRIHKDRVTDREMIAISLIKDHKDLQQKYEDKEKKLDKMELDLYSVTRELDLTKHQLLQKEDKVQTLLKKICKSKERYELLYAKFTKSSAESMELKANNSELLALVKQFKNSIEKTKKKNRVLQEAIKLRCQKGTDKINITKANFSDNEREYIPKKYVSRLMEADCDINEDKNVIKELGQRCQKLSKEKKTLENIVTKLTERVRYLLGEDEKGNREDEKCCRVKKEQNVKFAETEQLSSFNPKNVTSSELKSLSHSSGGNDSKETFSCNRCLSLQSVITERENMIKMKENIIQDLEKQIIHLRDEIEQKVKRDEEMITSMQLKLKHPTREILASQEKSQMEITPSPDGSSYSKQENGRLQNEVLDLQEKLKDALTEIGSLQGTIDENARLKTAVVEVEKELDTSANELKSVYNAKEENMYLKERIDNLEKMLSMKSIEVKIEEELAEENKNLKGEIDALKENALKDRNSSEKMSSKLQTVIKENSQLKEDIEKMCKKDKLSELQKDVDHLEMICQELRTENQGLIDDLENKNSNKQVLESKIATLEENIEDLKSNDKYFQDKEEEMFELNKQIERLQNDILEKAEEIKSLEASLAKECAEVGRLTNILDEMRLQSRTQLMTSNVGIEERNTTDIEDPSEKVLECHGRNEVKTAGLNRQSVNCCKGKADVKLLKDSDEFDCDLFAHSYVPTWAQPSKKGDKKAPKTVKLLYESPSSSKGDPSSSNKLETKRPQSQPPMQSELIQKEQSEVKGRKPVTSRPAWSGIDDTETFPRQSNGSERNNDQPQNLSQRLEVKERLPDSSDPFATSLEVTANNRREKRASFQTNANSNKVEERPKTTQGLRRVNVEEKTRVIQTIDDESDLEKVATMSRRQRGSLVSLELSSLPNKDEPTTPGSGINHNVDDFEDELDKFTKFEAKRKKNQQPQVQPRRRSVQGDELKILSFLGE